MANSAPSVVCRAAAEQAAGVEVRREHHDHADEPDRDRRPAVDAHALMQDERGEGDRDQRRRESDGSHLGERQAGQRREAQEHADDAEQAAGDVAERPTGAHGRDQLAPPGKDQNHGDDRECAAEEHHLADRHVRAHPAHQRRHHGEHQRRGDFEQDGFDGVHVGDGGREIVGWAKAPRSGAMPTRIVPRGSTRVGTARKRRAFPRPTVSAAAWGLRSAAAT